MAETAQNGGGLRSRLRPNVLVTGTPGTGKTTMSSLVADATGMRHFNISDLAREKGLHDGWDDELDCHVINEDMVRIHNFALLDLCVSMGRRRVRMVGWIKAEDQIVV
jgi:broad-specificity NMP kinase